MAFLHNHITQLQKKSKKQCSLPFFTQSVKISSNFDASQQCDIPNNLNTLMRTSFPKQHSTNRRWTGSPSWWQRWQQFGPIHPLFIKLSHVLIIFLIQSHEKHLILIGNRPFHKSYQCQLRLQSQDDTTMQWYTRWAITWPFYLLKDQFKISGVSWSVKPMERIPTI